MDAMIVLLVMRLSHLCFNSIHVTIAEIVELQCFFNKVASALQSAVNKSTMYVLLQTHYLEIYEACLFLLQLLSFLVNYPKHPFGQLIAAVVTLTSTHFGNLRALYYRLNVAIAGSVIVLYAATGIAQDTKCSVNNQLSRF
jgi:hypothetical protein